MRPHAPPLQVDGVRGALAAGDPSLRANSTLAMLMTTRDDKGQGLTDKQVSNRVCEDMQLGRHSLTAL